MNNNVVDIFAARKNFRAASKPAPMGAVLLSLKTKRDRHLVYLKRAERLFITAETLAGMPGAREQAIEMMMRLSADNRAGAFQGRAASWLFDNMRALVTDSEGLPVSPRLRRRALAKSRD